MTPSEEPGAARGPAYRTTIKDWPETDRPREKLFQHGAAILSEAELLAILIRAGNKGVTALDLARRLLRDGRTLRDVAQMSTADLQREGLGKARAAAVMAAFELSRRVSAADNRTRLVFRSPEDVARRYVPKLRDLRQEEFWIVMLNAANHLMKDVRVTAGTLNAALADPRECFHHAVREKAASVIFVHNHPSGNPEPSQEDLAMTRQLVEAGRILGIPVHDHLIVAGDQFISLADRGLV